MFLTINGKLMNSEHVGTIKLDSVKLTITYVFEGGRSEIEFFSTEDEFNAKVQQLGQL